MGCDGASSLSVLDPSVLGHLSTLSTCARWWLFRRVKKGAAVEGIEVALTFIQLPSRPPPDPSRHGRYSPCWVSLIRSDF